MPKVSVYITTHNYGRYINQAVDSVLAQTFKDWELIIIDDGSTDNTQETLARYSDNAAITVIKQENKGLNISNNVAIRLSRGDYVMRLDADDYLDENCLLVLSNALDQKPEIGLVYPDFYNVDENGKLIEIIRRKKIGEEVELLDLPAHGACTMIRKEVLVNLGSYSEEYTCQDGYDMWLRLIQNYAPYNVNVPLFYYRQHPQSLTQKQQKILDTRGEIKRKFVERNHRMRLPKTLGIIPVLSSSVYHQNRPFVQLAGHPLIWYTLSEAVKAESLDKIAIAAEDDETLAYVEQNFPGVWRFKRSAALSAASTTLAELSRAVLEHLKESENYEPEAICLLYISTPLRRTKHINQALDTMTIFEVDTVISIQEELAPCYHHERYGLTPINGGHGQPRLERDAVYKENGAIFLSRTDVIAQNRLIGRRIGHITMLPEESVKLNTDFEFWLVEKILSERQKNKEEAAA